MKICEICGSKTEDGAQFCEKCGTVVSFEERDVTTVQKKSPKGKWSVVGIFATIIVVALCRLIGGYAGETLGERIAEKDGFDLLDTYSESKDDYPRGFFTEEKYISEHFGFQFETGDNWIMYSEEELEPVSNQLRESTLSGAVKNLEENNFGEALIEKWKETVYVEAEMCAAYVSGDSIVGEVTVGVFGFYGMSDLDSDDIIGGMKGNFLSMDGAENCDMEFIAGEEYETVKISLTVEGMNLVNKMYVRGKDGMFCMIICKAVEGYEDEVFASLEEQISRYDS